MDGRIGRDTGVAVATGTNRLTVAAGTGVASTTVEVVALGTEEPPPGTTTGSGITGTETSWLTTCWPPTSTGFMPHFWHMHLGVRGSTG